MYKNFNLQDSILSKYKNKVTWENLEKCKEKGWEGISKNIFSVSEIAKIENINRVIKFDSVYRLINKITNSDTYEELDDLTQEIDKELKDMYSEEYGVNDLIFDHDVLTSIGRAFGEDGEDYFSITNDGDSENYYYPNKRMFDNNKYLAENGQKYIKSIKFDGMDLIKDIKEEYNKMDQVNYKNNKLRYDDNMEQEKEKLENKKQNMLIKYKYTMFSYKVKIYTRFIKILTKLLYYQRNLACKNYVMYIRAINKYC